MTGPGDEVGGPSDGPGARLQREREQAALTEQEAAERLNLDINVVAALESDDYAALGAAVFARGHLRRYAALLGLPEDDVLDAYERSRGHLEQPSLIPRSREAMQMGPTRSAPRLPWLAGSIALFLLAAGVVAYVSEYGLRLPWAVGTGPPQSQPGAAPSSDPSRPAAAAVSQENAVTRPAQSGPLQQVTPPVTQDVPPAGGEPAALPPGQVRLKLSFAADSWVEVYDGSGKAVLYDLGLRGTERSVVATAPLSVAIGNGQAVTALVNGKPVTMPLPPAGQIVARFSIGPDGALR